MRGIWRLLREQQLPIQQQSIRADYHHKQILPISLSQHRSQQQRQSHHILSLELISPSPTSSRGQLRWSFFMWLFLAYTNFKLISRVKKYHPYLTHKARTRPQAQMLLVLSYLSPSLISSFSHDEAVLTLHPWSFPH